METVASPYFTLTGCWARCPLVARGWITRPSTAAQIRSFRAILGILSTQELIHDTCE